MKRPSCGEGNHRFSYLHTNLVGGLACEGSWCVICNEPMPKEMMDRILAERQAPFAHLPRTPDGLVHLSGEKPK